MTSLSLGNPWAWLIAGLLLGAAEMLVPGVFLLFIGLAAIATGLVLFVAPLGMAWTLMLFGAVAIVCVLIGRKFYGTRDAVSDKPFLNRRADALIGNTYILDEAMKNGEGRVRVHDSVWRVTGPDMPAGTKVKVTGVENGVLLKVEMA